MKYLKVSKNEARNMSPDAIHARIKNKIPNVDSDIFIEGKRVQRAQYAVEIVDGDYIVSYSDEIDYELQKSDIITGV